MEEPLEAAAAGARMADEEPTGRPGVFRGMLAAFLEVLKTRLDLAAVETEIYLAYLAQTLLWGFAAVVCAVLGIFFALAAVVAVLWSTHPFAGLLGSMFVLFVLAVLCGTLAARSLRSRPQLLSGTLEQLGRDERRMSGSESDR
jgi:uncharacterized membrane protein YqjE